VSGVRSWVRLRSVLDGGPVGLIFEGWLPQGAVPSPRARS